MDRPTVAEKEHRVELTGPEELPERRGPLVERAAKTHDLSATVEEIVARMKVHLGDANPSFTEIVCEAPKERSVRSL